MPAKDKTANSTRVESAVEVLSSELLDHRSSSSDQVDNQHDHGRDQQQVDQAAGHVEAESQKPENQQDGKDCPEHIRPSIFELLAR